MLMRRAVVLAIALLMVFGLVVSPVTATPPDTMKVAKVTGTYTYHTFSPTPVRTVSVDAHETDPVKGTWWSTRFVDPVETHSGPVTCVQVSGDDAWLAGPTWDGTGAVFMWVHDGGTPGRDGDTALTWYADPDQTLAEMEAACENMTTTPFGYEGGMFDVVSGNLNVWDAS